MRTYAAVVPDDTDDLAGVAPTPGENASTEGASTEGASTEGAEANPTAPGAPPGWATTPGRPAPPGADAGAEPATPDASPGPSPVPPSPAGAPVVPGAPPPPPWPAPGSWHPGQPYAAGAPDAGTAGYAAGAPPYAASAPPYAASAPPYGAGAPPYGADATGFSAGAPPYGTGTPGYGAGAPSAVPAAAFAGAPGYGPSPYGPAVAFAQSAPSDPGPYAPGPYGPGPGPYGHQPPPGWGWPPGGYPPPPPLPPRKPPRTAEERRRRRRFSLILVAIVVVAIGAGIGIGAAVAPTSPTAVAQGLVHQAVTAATNAGSFRYSEVSTASGPAGEQILGDAGHNGGRQEITQQGASGLDRFTLRLVNGVVYFKGNPAAVVDQLGVAATKATKVSTEWVKVVKGNAPYKTFEPGITVSSNISQLNKLFVAVSSRSLSGSSPAATEVDGGINTGKGHALGSAHLVLATATSRPERFTAVNTGATGVQSVSLHWRFGHYGEKVDVPAPSGAVAYSSLGATPPNKTASKTSSNKG